MNLPILIVEDDRSLLQLIRTSLEDGGYEVVVAHCGGEALRLAKLKRPRLVLLDLGLPDLPGEEVCRGIKELGEIPIIMMTAKAAAEERLAGFALGADDYVVKPFSLRELVLRVKCILKRVEAVRNEASRRSYNRGRLVLDADNCQVSVNGSPALLTPTEFRLLKLLATHSGKVFTREGLVEKVLGYCDGYERCVDAHVKNIRHKLGENSRHPLFIETVYGVGYRFNGQPDT